MSEETNNWYLSGNLHIDNQLTIHNDGKNKPKKYILSIEQISNTGVGADSNALLRFFHSNGGNDREWIIGTGCNTLFGYPDNFGIRDMYSDKTAFVINTSGSVGIGTIEPKATLDVNGGAFLGYENSLADFGVPLKSGFYQGVNNIIGDVPDQASGWTHLIAARHSTPSN